MTKKTLKKVYKAWMKFAYFLGEINAFVILTLFFIFVAGVYALVLRFINLFKPSAHAGWVSKSYREPGLPDLRKQF